MSKQESSDKFSIPLINEEKVMKLIANQVWMEYSLLKIFRLAAPVLTKPITNILNLSISTGHFPSEWKLIGQSHTNTQVWQHIRFE